MSTEAIQQTTATEAASPEVTAMDKETLVKAAQEPEKETPAAQTEVKEVKTDTPAVSTAQEPSEVAKVQQELEKLKKQVVDKDTYIRNRESIIGQQNQHINQLKQQAETLRTQANEKFYDNPAESTRMVYQAERAEEQAQQIEHRQQYEANRQAITQFVPDYQDLVGDIAEIITERGYPPHLIERFKSSPWDEPVHVAVPFAEAARARKLARELQGKIKNLDKKPEEVAMKIAKAASQTPGITAANGGSGSETPNVTITDIRKMSRSQLKEYLTKTQ